jgi:hypothetical protein
MIARGFRPVGWVAALGAAALGCYMLSLRVASERADVDRLDRRIVAAQQSIRTLQTEVGTRSRIPQLEEWNNEVLALAAPVSGQFVAGNASLARFDIRQPQLAEPAEVRLASADVPAAARPAAPAPAPVASAAPAPRRAVAAPAPSEQPRVRRASLEIGADAPAPVRSAVPKERTRPTPGPTRTAASPERARPAAAPVRTASAEPRRARPAAVTAPTRAAAAPARQARNGAARPLLDERTLRALGSTSRGERQRGTRD